MKHSLLNLLIVTTLLMALTSCHDDWDPDAPKAQGQLALGALVIDVPQDAGITVEDFSLTVRDANGSPVLTTSYAERPATLSLPEGEYSLECANMTLSAPAWWDTPYYHGTLTVSIDRRKTTVPPTLTAKMDCIGVNVTYSIPDASMLTTTVTYGNGAALDFAHGDGRTGYFALQNGATTLMAWTTSPAGDVAIRQNIAEVRAGETYTFDIAEP